MDARSRILFLINPLHTRTYFGAAEHMALAEARILGQPAGIDPGEIECCEIVGIEYISVPAGNNSEGVTQIFGRASFGQAAYISAENGALIPLEMPDKFLFGGCMSAMMKYKGKTNELFTRLLINIALTAGNRWGKPGITILDPLCGKGTTLFEGMSYGFNVTGVEASGAYCLEIKNFLTRYLKLGKYKHRTANRKVSDENGKKFADVFSLFTADDKTDYTADKIQAVNIANCDTADVSKVFGQKFADIIVTDLPYGVQHAGKSAEGDRGLCRPDQLLKRALPIWGRALKGDGVMVLSYNANSLKSTAIADLVNEAGLRIDRLCIDGMLRHWVSESIVRDVVIIRK